MSGHGNQLILSSSSLLKEVEDSTDAAAEDGQHVGEGEVLCGTDTPVTELAGSSEQTDCIVLALACTYHPSHTTMHHTYLCILLQPFLPSPSPHTRTLWSTSYVQYT